MVCLELGMYLIILVMLIFENVLIHNYSLNLMHAGIQKVFL